MDKEGAEKLTNIINLFESACIERGELSCTGSEEEWEGAERKSNDLKHKIIAKIAALTQEPKKVQILTMFDRNSMQPLTLAERKNLIHGCMTVLLDDGCLSVLGILLSRFEETCRKLESDIAALTHEPDTTRPKDITKHAYLFNCAPKDLTIRKYAEREAERMAMTGVIRGTDMYTVATWFCEAIAEVLREKKEPNQPKGVGEYWLTTKASVTNGPLHKIVRIGNLSHLLVSDITGHWQPVEGE